MLYSNLLFFYTYYNYLFPLNFRMACSKIILASAVLVLMAMKPMPTVTLRRTKISLKTKVNFDFDSSKPIFSKYYGNYDCEGENDCQGDYDTTTTEPIKSKQPMWKVNSKIASGEYGITQHKLLFLSRKMRRVLIYRKSLDKYYLS